MGERAPAPDQGARDRIAGELQQTLFVEAGAGSGKTTALVDRVLALVIEPADPAMGSAPVSLASVAAITFTEKAGAELRERLRERLERVVAEDPGSSRASSCRGALDELDGAAIGTLHSFAQRILSEHPIEAGLPPRVEVLDEVTSGVEFERRWAQFADDLFEDPAYERTLLMLFAAGVRDTTPHALARTFNHNWDLVEECVPVSADPPGPVAVHLDDVLERIAAACDQVDLCDDPSDLLAERLGDIAEWLRAVRSSPDELAMLEALRSAREANLPSFRCRGGKKASWRVPVAQVKSELAEVGTAIDLALAAVGTEGAHHLGSALRRFTLAAADERRRAGALEFHDLLVMARSLLRSPTHGAHVRAALSDHYQRLLLDEFQDTDPIQIELAVRIAAAEPASDEAGTAPWSEVEVGPGRLFIVGDPKQSIYRFRRADIALFLAAARRFAPEGEAVTLTTNFRTGPGIIDWVNTTFTRLMDEPPGPELPDLDSQPDYTALQAVRSSPGTGPGVAVLGRQPHPAGTRAAVVREAEASEVVGTIQRAVSEAWQVADGDAWRSARLGDITILVPARTSLPYLEDALERAGIAYRAEASSLVYATRAVRDLLMVVRAVADPTDHLRVVSALRTPLFGCGDDDLYRYHVEHGGSWSYLTRPPETVPADDPVAAGLRSLAGWHRERAWVSPSGLLDRIACDRRALELGFAEGRPRDVWRRIRFIIDQARAWTDATGGDLRSYLEWVALQTVEGARVAEAVLPETDDDAVRIMTIHAAKGLEFPITIVSGMSTNPQRGPRAGDAGFGGGKVSYYLAKSVETPEFTAARPVDEQMAFDERVRLLYVATTRAQDHLVVSLHRAERKTAPSSPVTRTSAELLVVGMGDLLDHLDDGATGTIALGPPPSPAPVEAPEPFEAWSEAHDRALAAASRPTTIAATALTDEGRPDVESPAAVSTEVVSASPVPDVGGQGVLDLGPVSGGPSGDHPPTMPADGADAGPRVGLDAANVVPGRHPDLDVGSNGTDAGLGKRPRDLDLPPWLKGRYGTAVGRAVHGILQTIDLAGGPDAPSIEGAVAAQCQAEAVSDRQTTVRELVGQALGAASVIDAGSSAHWREVYVGTSIGEVADRRLLEGYVDLLYRSPDGLVVVDYKTAATADPGELDRRVEGYRLQGASYALAVERATGEPVVRVTFLFLTPEGAVERHLHDLEDAIIDVEAMVLAGTAVAVD